jgi:predicted ATPase
VYSARADPVRCDEVRNDLEALARELGSDEHRLLTDSVALRNAATQGLFDQAHALADGRLAPLLAAGISPVSARYGADPVIGMAGHHAFVLWNLGDLERARTVAAANLAAIETAGVSKFTQAVGLGLAGIVAMLDRDSTSLRQRSERLLALTAEQSFPFWSALGLGLHGWALVHGGELEEGLGELERARAELEATGARLFSTYIMAFLAEARLRRGDLAAGLADADEGLRLAETTYDRSYWPELWRLKGELLLASAGGARRRREGSTSSAKSDPAAAENCLLEALERARTCHSKSLELRAATSLARAWLARGRNADAQKLLDPLCRWFGDASSADLEDARALSAGKPTSPGGAAGRRGRR